MPNFMPNNLQIQDRDKKIFYILNQTKFITTAAAGIIYQTKSYHRKRLQYLAAHGYLEQFKKTYLLGTKGAKEIGATKPRVSLYQYKPWCMASDVNVRLKDFDLITTSELRQRFNQNKEVKYRCGLQHKTHEDVFYMAFFVPKSTSAANLVSIKNEIAYLSVNQIATRAVIFADEPYKIWPTFESVPQAEVIYILPHYWGLTILEYSHSQEYANIIKRYITGSKPSQYSFADWQTGDIYWTDLLTNNSLRRNILQRVGTNGQKVNAFCLDLALESMQEQMPDVNFIPVKVPGLPFYDDEDSEE